MMQKEKNNFGLFLLSSFISSVFCIFTMSLANADSLITISGSVMAPPACTINGNEMLSISFGNDLLTKNIDGNTYSQRVNYTYDCDKSHAWLKLKIDGVPFINTDALKTNKNDLGIAFRADGSLLRIGQSLVFSSDSPPVIMATPVKRSGSTLTGGPFFAGATLSIEFN
ncbi:fimbrial protein [Serratia ureilytica]|nr:fimbrial protein [Serratia ureilytica]